ncbi:MAG: formate--phosphoribosylaminoimidazolecarboxamide ligase [Candidatus Heimdallarchaeota archaeon]
MTSIATLGSHSALQILKGAKDEGLKTVLVCTNDRKPFYNRFNLVDHYVMVDQFSEISHKEIQQHLIELDSVLVPHGTLISNVSLDTIEQLAVPFFGNKHILRWEADRNLKHELMKLAGMKVPQIFQTPEEIDRPVIVKFPGAEGGRGYFLAKDSKDFSKKIQTMITRNLVNKPALKDVFIQEYVFGIAAYPHFFYSPLLGRTELLGIDRRYESDVDGLGRIPAEQQLEMTPLPTYSVIGNIPLVLRESLVQHLFEIGESFVEAARQKVPPGMIGAFCIEGVYNQKNQFIPFEFSARIVAGTNLFIDGSPYSQLYFNEPMSMGKRIAREIKIAAEQKVLDQIIT